MRSGDYGNQILDENCQLSVSEECLRESFNLYEKGGCHKKDARNFHNTVSLPLLEESDETLVSEKVIIPELHIIQGFVNHLFWDGIVPLLGQENSMKWP